MDWSDARTETLRKWQGILEDIGKRDEVALIARLNEVCALCDEARREADDPAERCAHCLVFSDPAQCADMRLAISEALIEGRQDEARAAVMAVVARIVAAQPPLST